MPLYEYECQACRSRMEFIQKFSDAPKKKCPECGGRLKRLISAPGIHFKGTGWYVTDYARGGSAGAPEPSGSNGSSAGSGESKSGEGKEVQGKALDGKGAGSSGGPGKPPSGSPSRRSGRRSARTSTSRRRSRR